MNAAASPQELTTLEQVRDAINDIDAQLVELIAQRQGYVLRAGELKGDATKVVDEERMQQILETAATQAESAGLEPAVARATFSAMLDAFVELEHEHVHDQTITK